MSRSSNLELLRIVSMLMVIFSHFFVNVPNPNNKYDLDFYGVITNFFQIGEIGVVCFVLLSGYFLIDKKFSIIKLLRYALQLWVTGVAILLFTYVVEKSLITSKYLYGSLLPFYSLNWFAKAYLLLYFLFPLINFVIHRVTREQLSKFILIFGFIWTVVPMASLYDYGNIRVSVIYIYIRCIFKNVWVFCAQQFEGKMYFSFRKFVCYLVIHNNNYLFGAI